ncbi:MAG: hypothetical protein NC483_03310 [Ruminococcus sp.]|nr:hypothetical protein [Ruminococcus sp.]
MDIDIFVNLAYNALKADFLEDFYDMLIEILESGEEGKDLELAINVKLKSLIDSSVLEDDIKELLNSLVVLVLEDIDDGLVKLKGWVDELKTESINSTEKIFEVIMQSHDYFSENVKKAFPKREFAPFEFMRDFYICLVKEIELKEKGLIVEDIDGNLILRALKSFQEKQDLEDNDFPKR